MLTLPPPHAAATKELFDQAEAVLRRMLTVEPRNAAALARLGDLGRARGDFAAALTAYRRLLAVAPDDAEAAWLVAVLGGDRLPEVPGGAVPFVRMTDFLPPASRDRLLRDVLAARERFAPGRIRESTKTKNVVRATLNREVRDAFVLRAPTVRDVRSWFLPKLRAVLPEVLRRLRMEDLDMGRIDVEVTVHLHGGFYTAHLDKGIGSTRHRVVSYVCYFHREPRPFAGGDLLLHDAGRAGGEPAGAFSRVEPLCGSIVFFPGDCLHEVTPWRVAPRSETGASRSTAGSRASGRAPNMNLEPLPAGGAASRGSGPVALPLVTSAREFGAVAGRAARPHAAGAAAVPQACYARARPGRGDGNRTPPGDRGRADDGSRRPPLTRERRREQRDGDRP